jgi:hypothetical protein
MSACASRKGGASLSWKASAAFAGLFQRITSTFTPTSPAIREVDCRVNGGVERRRDSNRARLSIQSRQECGRVENKSHFAPPKAR